MTRLAATELQGPRGAGANHFVERGGRRRSTTGAEAHRRRAVPPPPPPRGASHFGTAVREASSGGTTTQSYGYDQRGNRVRIGYPSGLEVQYGFDYAGRQVSAASADASYAANAKYAPFGPLLSLDFGNQTRREVELDARYRMRRNRLVAPAAAPLVDYQLDYDPAGNVTGIHDLLDPTYDRLFRYDDLSRLTAAETGPALWGTGQYDYDAMGNMVSKRLGGDQTLFGYEGTTPLLRSITPAPGGNPGDPVLVDYDSVGNFLGYPEATPIYSPRNLVTGYQLGGLALKAAARQQPSITLSYDGRGLRCGEALSDGTFAYGITYSYSPEYHLLERQITGPFGPGPLAPWTEAYTAIWMAGMPVASRSGRTPPGEPGPFSFQDPPRFTFVDHLGTPLLQTDANADVVWRVESEPYGADWQMRAGEAGEQILRFPGQERVLFGDMIGSPEERYNIHRWYEPTIGRFTTPDSFGLAAGTNLYAYATSNPLATSDPLGLEAIPVGFSPESLQNIQRTCAPGTLGCTQGPWSVGCECKSPKPCWWFARPSVKVGPLLIRYASDCNNPQSIIAHEQRHVRAIQQAFDETHESAMNLARERFTTKEACESACSRWVFESERTLGSSLPHMLIDLLSWPRWCKGSF